MHASYMEPQIVILNLFTELGFWDFSDVHSNLVLNVLVLGKFFVLGFEFSLESGVIFCVRCMHISSE